MKFRSNPMQDWSEGGEAGQYNPGASSTLMQIVPYSASLYNVFHSVNYNSVFNAYILCLGLAIPFLPTMTTMEWIVEDMVDNGTR